MVCWLVGGKCVKGKLSHINLRQFQTLPNIKRDQYKQLSCQPKPSQGSPDASDRASEDPRFSTFWKSVKWLWPPEAQLSTSPQASMTKFGWILYVLTALGQNMRSLTWKMAEPQSLPAFFPIIISAQGRMVCWVGLFRLQIFQRDFAPFSTIDTSKHQQRPIQTTFQSTKTIPGVPRRLWPSLRRSKIFNFLEIGQVTMTPRGSIGNFNFWPFWPKSLDTIWIRLFEPKDGIIKVERWPSRTVGPELFLSLYRVKAIWSVGWSVANVLSQIIPDQH